MKLTKINGVIFAMKKLIDCIEEAEINGENIRLLCQADAKFAENSAFIARMFSTQNVITETPVAQPVAEDVNEADITVVSDVHAEKPDVEIVEETKTETKTETKQPRKVRRQTVEELIKEYPKAWGYVQKLPKTKENATTVHNKFLKVSDEKIGLYKFAKLLKHWKDLQKNSKASSEKKVVTSSEPKKETPIPVGEYRVYPKNDGVRFFEDGTAVCRRKDGTWSVRKATINGGYLIISYQGKTISLAKAMLETWKPMSFNDGMVHVPFYKDGNKLNCHLDNLSWEKPMSTVTVQQIHEACRIIAENPNAGMEKWLAIMAERGEGVQNNCLKSILKGEYTNISEKYFTLRCGKPIVPTPSKTEPTTVAKTESTEDDKDMSKEEAQAISDIFLTNLVKSRKGDIISIFREKKDLKIAVKAYEIKRSLGMPTDMSDNVIPVLEFIKDENGKIRSSEDIMKFINDKYGKVFITPAYILDVKQKRFKKDLCDFVF